MKKVVLSLSGGMDSATLLGYILNKELSSQEIEVHCCSFIYGSKHNPYELEAAKNTVQYYKNEGFNIVHNIFDLTESFANFTSNLLTSGGEIPEGHYESENMKKTVVPGRNLIFASILSGYAESVKAESVFLGVHSGDHHIYPDCRPNFITSLMNTVMESTEGKVLIKAPFMFSDKTDLLKLGYSYTPKVPYHLTRTCYKAQELACGKCGSCQERLEAFRNINKIDPVDYEGN